MQIKQLIKISEELSLGWANQGNRLGQLSTLVLDTGMFSEKTSLDVAPGEPAGSADAEMHAGRLQGLWTLSEELAGRQG